jgi:NADP-dependent 3-hydroxy acid dehydrogenase YdfG
MSKTILVCGFGTGISSAVAERFGKAGFAVALVGRNAERLATGVKSLTAQGITAAEFIADLSEESQISKLVESVRNKLGAITAIHWNAYSMGAGDLLTADSSAIRKAFDLPVTNLLMTLRAALPELEAQPESALLVTNGGLGLDDPQVDAMAVAWNAMDLAVVNAAKHKLVGLLSQKLRPKNIYVGEVLVLGPVKGTAWDDGNAKIHASSVADKFWELYQSRTTVSASVG